MCAWCACVCVCVGVCVGVCMFCLGAHVCVCVCMYVSLRSCVHRLHCHLQRWPCLACAPAGRLWRYRMPTAAYAVMPYRCAGRGCRSKGQVPHTIRAAQELLDDGSSLLGRGRTHSEECGVWVHWVVACQIKTVAETSRPSSSACVQSGSGMSAGRGPHRHRWAVGGWRARSRR